MLFCDTPTSPCRHRGYASEWLLLKVDMWLSVRSAPSRRPASAIVSRSACRMRSYSCGLAAMRCGRSAVELANDSRSSRLVALNRNGDSTCEDGGVTAHTMETDK